uniref:Transposase MuDR plant domain-containing protein n=1 Tax=Nelumbo nucifera TaxID=4432 RepID=A0A822Z7C3_NELNU|nr:TPA_asm: hypothetical protein HUJ06_013178 [Nelumbo nucifera]
MGEELVKNVKEVAYDLYNEYKNMIAPRSRHTSDKMQISTSSEIEGEQPSQVMDGSRYMFIINYGGHWKSIDGKLSYVNGQIGHVDSVDSDGISYLDILNDFCSLAAIPPGSIVTINYKILGWDLEEHLGVLGCENDVMDMFAIHGDLRKIIFYVIYTEAKCVSMDDGCNGKGKEQMQDDDDDVDCYVVDDDNDDVVGHSHGNDEGLDGHHDVDDGEFEGLYDDGDAYWDDDGEGYSYDVGEDYSDDDGGEDDDDGDQESSDGGDHEGLDEDDGNEGVHDGGGADLSDYEPTSEYDSPRERGNTLEFDFSKPRFQVGMEFTNVKEFRQALRHYGVVEGIEIKRKKNEKGRFIEVCAAVDYG